MENCEGKCTVFFCWMYIILMKYPEYYNTAVRHLNSCDSFLKSVDWTSIPEQEKKHALRDIYYISGYIFEAFTVFIAYKYGDFPPNSDIDEFNREFTKKTYVDFYPRKEINGRNTTKRCYSIPKKKESLSSSDQLFLNGLPELYAVEQHHFQEMTKWLQDKGLIPPSLNLPYFVDAGAVTPPVTKLIENWKSCIRYSSRDYRRLWADVDPLLTESNMKDLIKICNEIKNNIR